MERVLLESTENPPSILAPAAINERTGWQDTLDRGRTDTAGRDGTLEPLTRLRGVKRRFPGGQTDEFHPQSIEHVFHHDLLVRGEVALRFFF
jgi:hypothetical protein